MFWFYLIGQVQREIALEDKYGSFARAEDLGPRIFQGSGGRPFRRGTNFKPFLSDHPSGQNGDGSQLSFQNSVLNVVCAPIFQPLLSGVKLYGRAASACTGMPQKRRDR